jgi:aminoglycoside/choline kinase family phosphotransferase
MDGCEILAKDATRLSDPAREPLKRQFLADAGLAGARREMMTGDASTRLYERLHRPNGATLILMDQPPRLETAPCPPDATFDERLALGYNAAYRLAAGRVDAFAAVAGHLHEQGFSTPRVIALDAANGFAVLEDLGDDLFAAVIDRGSDPRPLYEAAMDLQAAMHVAPPPAVLVSSDARWPLLTYDALALKIAVDTFIDWWPRYLGAEPYSTEALAEWDALWAPIRARGESGADVFTHRDFHAENLLWLPEREGHARIGLLDFQDAVRGHRAWDLLHLLQGSGRRDVDPALEAQMLDRYLAASPGVDRASFLDDYAALAALNNARLVGLWARLVIRDGKPSYARFLPRTWRRLERDLTHPALAPLRAWFDRYAPADTRPRETTP